jgi:MoaA/NifB/PqqE/SkfB family radical SAM enzyme
LLGGEPLLHPEIAGVIETARAYFPETEIGILTNGLLLPKMNADFWDCCREHDIKITITRYPVKIDIAAIKETAKNAGVRLNVLYEEDERSFYFKPLSRDRKSRPKNNFRNCWHANRCIHLRDGRLSCAVVSYINILTGAITNGGGGGQNRKFEVCENDYIDIYRAKNIDGILDFLTKPIPFCRYCDFRNISFGRKWAVSEKKLSEWIQG